MANETIVRLVAGRHKTDLVINPANIPSTNEKAALAGTSGTATSASNKLVDNADTRIPTQDENDALQAIPGHTPSGANRFAPQSYVDNAINGLDWQESVKDGVDYVKAGAPTGVAATNGEKCLNTSGALLHTFTGGAWDAGVSVSAGNRFIFKDTGTDTSGNSGTHTADNKIRQYNGTTFDQITPDKATAVNVEDENSPDGVEYVYNGTSWVKKGSSTQHNNLGSIQGGNGSTEYYHLTADQEAGIDAATAITSANPPQTLADRDKVPSRLTFNYFGGFAQGQTDVEVFEASGIMQRVVMPKAGSIVKTSYQSDQARTAGILTVEPTINGTKATNNSLDLAIDGTTTNDAKASVAPASANLTFNEGDKLGFMVTSDAPWANANGDIQLGMYVVFND